MENYPVQVFLILSMKSSSDKFFVGTASRQKGGYQKKVNLTLKSVSMLHEK